MIQIRSVMVQSALAGEAPTAAAESTALPPASGEGNAQHGKTIDASLFASLGEPAIAHSLKNDSLAAVALNPQPLPPRELATPAETADSLLAASVSHAPRIPHVPAMPSADCVRVDPSSIDAKVSDDLSAQDRLGNFKIQQLMSDYNQAEQLASSMQKKRDDATASVIGKIG